MSVLTPFGISQITLSVKFSNAGILESHAGGLKAADTEDDLVLATMESPIDSARLRELVAGKKTCTIIAGDHTCPVPSKHIIPFILAELREENLDTDIALLVATGFHRPTDKQGLAEKLEEEIVEREKVEIHDSRDASCSVQTGTLPSGAAYVIDKKAAQTDLLIAEGFIEPHFFVGFSGGRKSVLPGICDRVTILDSHCSQFIASSCAHTGVPDGNPLHKGMAAATKVADLAYIVDVIIDENKRVVAAFTGDLITARRKGCDLLLNYCQVQPEQHGDIVISSNGDYPLGRDIYQNVKNLTAAEAATAPGTVLIMVSSCNDGHGGENFYRTLRDCISPQQLAEQILVTPQDQTMPDQWEFQILCQVLCKHHMIYVTDPVQKETVEDMKIAWALDVDTALQQAKKTKGESAYLVAIPNRIFVMVQESV